MGSPFIFLTCLAFFNDSGSSLIVSCVTSWRTRHHRLLMTRYTSPVLTAFAALACAVFVFSSPVLAQSAQCQGWQAELASIGRDSGRSDSGAAQQAQRVGGELSRTINQYRGMGCERQQGLFFGEAPPPQCGVIRQRIGELQTAFAALQQRAQGGGNSQRRAQLQAAIDANCRPGIYQTPEPTRPRGFFEALFGLPERQPQVPSALPELDPAFDPDKLRTATWGAGRAVCVRTCDGFFFPLANSSGGRESADDMCQALCPATETNVFYMGGSGEIESAMGRNGPYTSLANANKYTRSFDAACTCRKPGESWSSALAEAEQMLARRKGDVIVSVQKAEELSKPRETRKTERDRKRTPESRANEAIAGTAPEPNPTAASTPTSGAESAGIGPQAISGSGTVSADQGQTRKLTTADGETRTVRIVAPALTPQTGGNRPSGQITTTR